MKISYNWLKQYIAIPESPEEIGKTLTSTGLEVESIEPFDVVKGGLKGLVIGEVLTCARHPNADKLSITTVDVGEEKPLHIVCGAPNVAAGQKVIVAVPRSTVHPSNGEPFAIKVSKIRGELSEGMICAEDEIGLGASHAGIIELNTTLKNGTPAATFYNIETDYVFEIGLTPNRADAASHIGTARDIKAALNRTICLPSVDQFKVQDSKLKIDVIVENAEACPRYSAVTLSGITVKESPDWLKNRLRAIGLTPINNVVDSTNYVLHELGQPLHAFDASKIIGNKVIVKTLDAGTKFTTLDGKERTLAATDLMICNQQEGMCLAGVFGGITSGIAETTTTVFLESAYFSAATIRKTSQHHQLKTDASFRYERGTDPNITVYALKRAALLIQEVAGGSVSSKVIDVYPTKIENKIFEVKDKNINRLIGKQIARETIFQLLERLDIQILEKQETSFVVSVPAYRVDVVGEAHIVEEILRIYGINNIELANRAGTDYLSEFPVKDINKFRRTIGELLVGNGFYELLTNSLTNFAYQQKLKLSFNGQPVEMLNKLSEEQGILRQTMLFTGLEVCAHNINRKQKNLKLFEFGKVYWKENGYHEEERLALYLTGNMEAENWQNKTKPTSYYDVAQQVSNIFEKCSLHKVKQENLQGHPLLEYGIKLLQGKTEIGIAGKVRPTVAKELGVKQEVFYADLDAALLFRSASPKFRVEEISKFPEVRRDLSLVLDKNVSFAEIKQLIHDTERKFLKDIIVFDVYEGDKIPEGKKAYALGFTLLDATKTLTDEEIDKVMNKLMAAFEQKMGALIRK